MTGLSAADLRRGFLIQQEEKRNGEPTSNPREEWTEAHSPRVMLQSANDNNILNNIRMPICYGITPIAALRQGIPEEMGPYGPIPPGAARHDCNAHTKTTTKHSTPKSQTTNFQVTKTNNTPLGSTAWLTLQIPKQSSNNKQPNNFNFQITNKQPSINSPTTRALASHAPHACAIDAFATAARNIFNMKTPPPMQRRLTNISKS